MARAALVTGGGSGIGSATARVTAWCMMWPRQPVSVMTSL
jgi:hypothetical protein